MVVGEEHDIKILTLILEVGKRDKSVYIHTYIFNIYVFNRRAYMYIYKEKFKV